MKYLFFLGLILIAIWFLSRPFPIPEDIIYGVTFSAPYARDVLGLNWKKAYSAVLDDLGLRNIRIAAYWNEHELKQGEFKFSDLDFMINEAGKRKVDLILAIGQKLPHWPECHIPKWASLLSGQERNKSFLNFLEKTVVRYKENTAIRYWQVENEPFLAFGECEDYDKRFVDTEINKLRSLDSRPIIVTDSGELSIWAPAYSRSDIFGTTMYRNVWNKFTGNFTYPLRPGYFRMKKRLMELIYGKKPIIVVELQGEPWMEERPKKENLDEQLRLMNPEKLKANIEYERRTGFNEVYLWGVEWWFWLKEKQDKPEMWEEAKKIFDVEVNI